MKDRKEPQDMNAEEATELALDTLQRLINGHKSSRGLNYGSWTTAEDNLALARKKRAENKS